MKTMKTLNHRFVLIGFWLAFAVVTPHCLAADTNGVYFLFVEWLPYVKDSFVAKLTRPADIQYARDLLRPGSTTQRKTAAVQIAAGTDGINRDYLAPGAPQWSWHIAQFWGFVEAVIPEDGANPTTIEQDVAGWIESRNGRAAFDYKPVLELLPPPSMTVSNRLTGQGLELSWTDLGIHYVYTLEVANSPAAPAGNWSPAPGVTWPVAATNWVDTALPATGSRYYRVKAELKQP